MTKQLHIYGPLNLFSHVSSTQWVVLMITSLYYALQTTRTKMVEGP